MISFAYPGLLYLLLIIPALAALFWLSRIARTRKLRRYGRPEVLASLMPDASRYMPWVKLTVALLALAFLIIVLARPRAKAALEDSARETETSRGIEVMVCLDVSNSMLASSTDDPRGVARLDRAKHLLERLVGSLRDDRVGLIVFAGDAFTQLPITSDYISAKMFLSSINPSMVSTQGTAIGAAINLAARSFTPDETTDKAIILITDGENHEDDAIGAAKAAADVQVLAPGSVRVNLTLRDVELKDLTPAARPDAELQVAFAAAANREFDGLITALYGINGPDADPLDLCFWLQNRYGSTQGALRAELTLHWHRPGEG